MMGAFIFVFLTGAVALGNVFGSGNIEFIDNTKHKNEHEVRAIYLTAHTAGNAKRRQALMEMVKSSDLNAVVIDVKDSTGKVFFETNVELARDSEAQNLKIAPELGKFLKELKKNNIYAIARIAVFEDPHLAEKYPHVAIKKKNGEIWRDKKGLAWVDPASPVIWKYNMDIAQAAMFLGFDELNFDYIRFPTDGNLNDIAYPIFDEKKEKKTDVIAQFFYYINSRFKNYPVYTSVDLFGITLWRSDGVSIGQRYQDASDYVDYISPMVYPSHYPEGFEGYANPADYPYEIVFESIKRSRDFLKNKRARIRPWLQDFDIGAIYDSEKLRAQMKATRDSGGFGYMFWNASNNYTTEAFYPEKILADDSE